MKYLFYALLAGVLAACVESGPPVNVTNPSPITEPYPVVKGAFVRPPIPHSPDPLVNYRWANPQADDDLEIYALSPETVRCDEVGAARWRTQGIVPIRVTGPCDLRFDFGRVSPGWLEFDCADFNGDVEMSISEYNEPAVFNAGSQHPVKTGVPVRYGDTYRLELNDDLYEGVRFGWIHIRSLEAPATITAVRLVCQTKPVNYLGSFSCDDDSLTRIWYTGAYTVRTNLLHDYFGAILMERSDRHAWTGDAHPSQAASMVAFGNFDFVRANLFFTALQFQNIAPYSLYWVLSLADYYQYTGDRETMEALLANACHKLDSAYTIYDSDLTVNFYGWDERLGAGFIDPDCTESQRAYRMLAIRTWRTFANAMAAYGEDELAAKYRGWADEKAAAVASPEFVLYGLHATAEAVNAGVGCATPEEREMVWNRVFADRLQRVSYSPFNQFFILQAMARLGRYPEAMTTIDDCWGGQLRYGGTTFFELFRPSWNTALGPNDAPINNQCGYTSLTHPWSAGVTKWLSEEVLGIRPTTPGFATFDIVPHLVGLTSVSGEVPTPHGIISASFDLTKGHIALHVPDGTEARLGIPKGGREIASVRFSPGEPDGEDADFVYYRDIAPGEYTVRVRYRGDAPAAPAVEPLRYRLPGPIAEDSVTGGNWRGVYGSRGYILCNYDGNGRDRTKLPDFVEHVVWTQQEPHTWAEATDNPRALQSDREGESARAAACISLDPIACRQTFSLDIRLRDDQPYRVALYFMDWECDGRRSAIEVFDLESRELLMPVHLVKEYREGRYVILPLQGSVRLRIDQVRGVNTALCGVFFD